MPSYFEPLLPSAPGLALGSVSMPWTIYSTATTPVFVYVNQVKLLGSASSLVLDATSSAGFEITLTGDVLSSTFLAGAGPAYGTGPGYMQLVVFFIIQDGAGHHKFFWPANFVGCQAIDNVNYNMNPNQYMLQMVYWSGTRGKGYAAAPTLFYP